MPSTIEAIEILEKSHDYYGKAKSLYDNVNTVTKAAGISPDDIEQFKKLVGISSKEAEKLKKSLDKRVKATEAAAAATYAEIPTRKDKLWENWAKMVSKHGIDSKEALSARTKYVSELKAYGKKLQDRWFLCKIHSRESKKQEKVYQGLVKAHKASVRIYEFILKTRVKSPETASHEATAFVFLKEYGSVGPKAKRIHEAHAKIAKKADAEITSVIKEKSINDGWLKGLTKDANKDKANRNLTRAFKALGVSV